MDQQAIITHGQAGALGAKGGARLARFLGAGSKKQKWAAKAGSYVAKIAAKKAAPAITKVAGMRKGGKVKGRHATRGANGRFV